MGNAIFKMSNLRKTYYYLKKNGVKNAYYAVLERIMREKQEAYRYEEPDKTTLEMQSKESSAYSYTFSILVPAYETAPKYLREMIDSVLNQTYGRLELIIADAGCTDTVRKTVEEYTDDRIRYISLRSNEGISENTNAALRAAAGDYIGLLDHDDVLTPDALFKMAEAIYENEINGNEAWMLYSDEDKGNGELTAFYEPHFKPELNVDLLLSNNYICHFLVLKKELMKELGFRRQYDGAQDYDLILRSVGKLIYERGMKRESVIHIPQILYHWRCHEASTAENPESKRYAYEAGKRALEDFLQARGWNGKVSHTVHLGFYQIEYVPDIFSQRDEIGVVCGKLLNGHRRISGGFYDAGGDCPYRGLYSGFSGYMHRAVLSQEVFAPDIRCMRVRKELQPVFKEIFGMPYQEGNRNGKSWFDYDGFCRSMKNEKEERELCMEFGRRIMAAGYTVVWQPEKQCER